MIYPDWKYKLALKHLSDGTEPTNLDVKNLLSVLKGTCTSSNAVKATIEALLKLRKKETIESQRNVQLNAVLKG